MRRPAGSECGKTAARANSKALICVFVQVEVHVAVIADIFGAKVFSALMVVTMVVVEVLLLLVTVLLMLGPVVNREALFVQDVLLMTLVAMRWVLMEASQGC